MLIWARPFRWSCTIQKPTPGAYKYFLDKAIINAPKRPFDRERLAWDKEIVTQNLRDLGYLDAVVEDVDVAFFDRVYSYEDRRRHGPKLVADGEYNDRAVITYTINAGATLSPGLCTFY